MRFFLLSFLLFSFSIFSALRPSEPSERIKELKAYLNKEKGQFEKHEAERKDAMEWVDRLNAKQNEIRNQIHSLVLSQQELTMALDNLSLEYDRQKQVEAGHHQQLVILLKVTHKIKRDGALRFILFGSDLTQMASRVRVLYRTLKSHSILSKQISERGRRLAEAESRIEKAKEEQRLLLEAHEVQEAELDALLKEKHRVLQKIRDKQNSYQVASRELKRISSQVNRVITKLDSYKQNEQAELPGLASLMVPVSGRVVQGFGRSIHAKFKTITFHKGIEIETDHNAPVGAVLPGTVEYSGWLRGLGNVLILHHGNALYSLYGHLFKAVKEVGNSVEQGETVGMAGDTGNSERPGLYFELRSQGSALDPVAYFSKKELTRLN